MIEFICDVCQQKGPARVASLRLTDIAYTTIQCEAPHGWVAILTSRRFVVACSPAHFAKALAEVPIEERPLITRAAKEAP